MGAGVGRFHKNTRDAFGCVKFSLTTGAFAMAAENLIMGFCTNMPADQVEVLCRSARATFSADEAEIVLITDDPGAYAERLEGLDVSYRLTTCDYRPDARRRERRLKHLAARGLRRASGGLIDRELWGGALSRFLPTLIESWCHPWTARWRVYDAVLRERPYVRRALMTDIKDVVVQADCFSHLEGDCVQIFQEDRSMDGDRCTAKWIAQGFGEAAVESMSGVKVVCMGTVLATREAGLRFLELIQSMFARYPCQTADQGTINWLLHKEGDPPYLIRVPNLEGAVATLPSDGVAVGKIEMRDGLIVRRSDGSVIPVVHMWDRWEKTKQPVLDRYLGRPVEALAAS